jgi:hypothetical protein
VQHPDGMSTTVLLCVAVLLLFAGLPMADANSAALGEAYLAMDVTDSLLQRTDTTRQLADGERLHEAADAAAVSAAQQCTASSKADSLCQCLAVAIEVTCTPDNIE